MSIKTLSLLLLLLLAAAACSPRPLDPGTSATGSATTTTSTSGPSTDDSGTSLNPGAPTTTTTTPSATTTTTSPTSASATTDPDPDPSGTYVIPPDGGDGTPECSQWRDDCPEGQKCMPFADGGGGSWNNHKCSDIVPDPAAPGEPCIAFGGFVSGEDTCEKHAMCWVDDPDAEMGICRAMCSGTPDAITCPDPHETCFLTNTIAVCFPQCDPIAQDCPAGHQCTLVWSDSDFNCTVDYSGDEGQLFDPCDNITGCDPGLFCIGPELASECDPMQLGCCLPFCDLDDPNPCPGQGQQCLPWYDDPEDAIPFNQDVGVCGIPMP